MFFRPLVAPFDERADGRRRGVADGDPVFLDQIPPAVLRGRVGRALVHEHRRAVGQRTVHDVRMPRDPAHVGGAPVNIVLAQIEDVFGRLVRAEQVTRRRVQNALRLAGRPARVQDEKRMLAVERFGGRVGGHLARFVVPPDIAARLHLDGVLRAAQHDHAAHVAVAVLERGIHVGLERHDLAAPPAAVGGDDQLRAAVAEPVLDRLRAEPPEHHRVHRADPRAGEHGHRRLGHQRQVEHHAVARRDAVGLEHVGEPADLRVQFAVGQRAGVAGFALEDDRRFVAAVVQMPVHAVFRDVEPTAGEPLRKRRRPFQHRAPRRAPEQFAGFPGPERVRLLDRKFIERLVLGQGRHTRLRGKLRGRREHTVFDEVGFDVLDGIAHGEERPRKCVARVAFAQVLSAGASAGGRRGGAAGRVG